MNPTFLGMHNLNRRIRVLFAFISVSPLSLAVIRRGVLQSCCVIRLSDVSLRDSSLLFFATTSFKNGKSENFRNLHFLNKGGILMHFF